jgi:hypothetical protein
MFVVPQEKVSWAELTTTAYNLVTIAKLLLSSPEIPWEEVPSELAAGFPKV